MSPFTSSSIVGAKLAMTLMKSTPDLDPYSLRMFINFILLINQMVYCQACISSNQFSLHRPRASKSHVFAPGERQPHEWEYSNKASGPIDSRDFQHTLPSKRLVRVDSTSFGIDFASEEARWMTKGCRDRLLKLATHVQNTWTKGEIILRVKRAWIKPPREHNQRPSSNNDKLDSNEVIPVHRRTESLFYNSRARSDDALGHRDSNHVRQSHQNQHRDSRLEHRYRPRVDPVPIKELTPDMIVDTEDRQLNRDYDRSRDSVIRNRLAYNRKFGRPTYHHRAETNRHYSRNKLGRPSQTEQSPIPHFGNSRVSNSSSSSRYYYPTQYSSRIRRSLSNSAFYASPLHGSFNNRNPSSMTISTTSTNNNNNGQYTLDRLRYQTQVESWLQLRMDDFHYAGRAVDLELVTSTYSTPANRDLHLGVLAQIAYYFAQFDWCYFNRAGVVHCSVKPDASITSTWFGCFPASTFVQTENGRRISMDSLEIGHRVLTYTSNKGHHYTKVVNFLHRDRHAWTGLVRLTIKPIERDRISLMNYTLQVTPDHLIYTTNFHTKFAGKLTLDDLVYVSLSSFTNHSANVDNPCLAQILEITHVDEFDSKNTVQTGLYAPLTESGSFLADGVLVSCFAQFASPQIAYYATLPMQQSFWWWWWRPVSSHDRSTDLSHWSLPTEQGVHWYADWLYRTAACLLPNSLFYH